MTEAAQESDARARLLAFAADRRLTLEAEFVPYSQSENARPRPGRDKPWPSLNWRVRLMVQPQSPGGAARELIATSYAAGNGHAPSYRQTCGKRTRENEDSARRVAWEIEHGRPAGRVWFNRSGGAEGRGGWEVAAKPGGKPLLPDLCDVLASLAMDSGVLDSGGFEDWAAEYGYDTDSRAAEAIYRACLEIAIKLRAGLGEDGLSALRDAAQDY